MLPWIIFTSSNLSVTGSSGRGGWVGNYTLADNRFEFKAFRCWRAPAIQTTTEGRAFSPRLCPGYV